MNRLLGRLTYANAISTQTIGGAYNQTVSGTFKQRVSAYDAQSSGTAAVGLHHEPRWLVLPGGRAGRQ